jgi:magnesium-transporting ATPase (P-type)
MQLLQGTNLPVNESPLTGESVAVGKDTQTLNATARLVAEQLTEIAIAAS